MPNAKPPNADIRHFKPQGRQNTTDEVSFIYFGQYMANILPNIEFKYEPRNIPITMLSISTHRLSVVSLIFRDSGEMHARARECGASLRGCPFSRAPVNFAGIASQSRTQSPHALWTAGRRPVRKEPVESGYETDSQADQTLSNPHQKKNWANPRGGGGRGRGY